jgi:hypothetical protein
MKLNLRPTCLILCLALLSVPAVPAWACDGSSERHTSRQPDKPEVALTDLSAAQIDALKAYGKSVLAMSAKETADAKDRRLTEAELARLKSEALRLGDAVDFRTEVVVGNGMLCGAAIAVQVPPRAEDLTEVLGDNKGVTMYIRGKARNGTVDEGNFHVGLLPAIIDEARKPRR